MKRVMCVLGTVLVMSAMTAAASAQGPSPSGATKPVAVPFGSGAKIFIDKMEGGLDGFLVAELTKKNVPLEVVLDEAAADFIMTGGSSERKASWHEGWLSADKDKATGSVMIVSKDRKLVWAEEAGDRSLWLGSLARGGPRKVASRIADRLKQHLNKRK